MAREIFVERRRVHFAPGLPSLRSQSLGAFENIVGDRYSCLHTHSTTSSRGRWSSVSERSLPKGIRARAGVGSGRTLHSKLTPERIQKRTVGERLNRGISFDR